MFLNENNLSGIAISKVIFYKDTEAVICRIPFMKTTFFPDKSLPF